MAVSTGNDDFRIIEKNPIYQDSLSILTASERQELAVIIQNLKKNPFRYRELRKPFEGRRTARFANGRYKLMFRVELNTRNVFLLYVGPRSRIYLT